MKISYFYPRVNTINIGNNMDLKTLPMSKLWTVRLTDLASLASPHPMSATTVVLGVFLT